MSYKARIKFDNREWLVIENIEYNGIKYYYIIEDISEEIKDLNSIEEYNGKFTVEFIYKIENGNYRNVTDQELISKLSALVGFKILTSEE